MVTSLNSHYFCRISCHVALGCVRCICTCICRQHFARKHCDCCEILVKCHNCQCILIRVHLLSLSAVQPMRAAVSRRCDAHSIQKGVSSPLTRCKWCCTLASAQSVLIGNLKESTLSPPPFTNDSSRASAVPSPHTPSLSLRVCKKAH